MKSFHFFLYFFLFLSALLLFYISAWNSSVYFTFWINFVSIYLLLTFICFSSSSLSPSLFSPFSLFGRRVAQRYVHTSLHLNVRFSTDLLDSRMRSAASASLWRRAAHSRFAERSQAGRREPTALPNERMENGSFLLDDSRLPREPKRASCHFGSRRTLSTNWRTVAEPNERRSGASLSRAALGDTC